MVIGHTVGYVRVSAEDRNPGRQVERLGECRHVFTDTISGKSRAKRKALAEMIDYVRDGETARIPAMAGVREAPAEATEPRQALELL